MLTGYKAAPFEYAGLLGDGGGPQGDGDQPGGCPTLLTSEAAESKRTGCSLEEELTCTASGKRPEEPGRLVQKKGRWQRPGWEGEGILGGGGGEEQAQWQRGRGGITAGASKPR